MPLTDDQTNHLPAPSPSLPTLAIALPVAWLLTRWSVPASHPAPTAPHVPPRPAHRRPSRPAATG